MADFSQYNAPSREWLALEPSLPKPPENLTVEELKAATNQGRESVSAVEMMSQGLSSKVILNDHSIPTRDESMIEGRTYRPVTTPISQRLPVYLSLHGGGFLFGSTSAEDASCSRIVVTLFNSGFPVVVVNVNYRHTPEHKYPTAWNDVEDAFHWIHDNLDRIGGDGDQVVIGGISAGAWLTASLTLQQHLAEPGTSLAKRPKICGQVLMIPCLVHMDCYGPQIEKLRDPDSASLAINRNAPVLPFALMRLFTDLLEANATKDDEQDVRLNPGNASAQQVRGLPPTTFGVAGRDMLRDEGLLFAKLLAENNVPTDVTIFPGLPHGFRRFGAKLSASKKWDETVCKGIRWSLNSPLTTGKLVVNVFTESKGHA